MALVSAGEEGRLMLLATRSFFLAVYYSLLGITLGWCWKKGFLSRTAMIRLHSLGMAC